MQILNEENLNKFLKRKSDTYYIFIDESYKIGSSKISYVITKAKKFITSTNFKEEKGCKLSNAQIENRLIKYKEKNSLLFISSYTDLPLKNNLQPDIIVNDIKKIINLINKKKVNFVIIFDRINTKTDVSIKEKLPKNKSISYFSIDSKLSLGIQIADILCSAKNEKNDVFIDYSLNSLSKNIKPSKQETAKFQTKIDFINENININILYTFVKQIKNGNIDNNKITEITDGCINEITSEDNLTFKTNSYSGLNLSTGLVLNNNDIKLLEIKEKNSSFQKHGDFILLINDNNIISIPKKLFNIEIEYASKKEIINAAINILE